MERFKFYGEPEKIISGDGLLHLGDENDYNVSYEIAKRGEEKLLFNVICKDTVQVDAIILFQYSGKLILTGKDELGRKVSVTELLIKDIETNTEGDVVINGYAGKCKIGEKVLSDGFIIQIDLINFLFAGNETNIEETEKGKRYPNSILQLEFPDFQCRIEQDEDYAITKQLLKRRGGVLKTSTLSTRVSNKNGFKYILRKVNKLCQLLSVARSTFINWGSYKLANTDGETIYEFYGNAQTKPFHGNNLIKIQPGHLEEFLKPAWISYDTYEQKFDMKRFLYGYSDTYINSYIESRCLNIAALAESISSRWAIIEGRDVFLEEKEFNKQLPKLKKGIKDVLKKTFADKVDLYKRVMVSKVKGLNRRPLNWKFKRLRKAFNCPITDEEIKRFVYLRDNLAHSSLFPEDEDNVNAFLFMRHFLDRIVLSVFGYSGKYFDMENRKEKVLIQSNV